MRKQTVVLLLLVVASASWAFWSFYSRGSDRSGWDTRAIRATYEGVQLKENDPQHASLLLTYELTNTTNSDSRLADGSNIVVMSRLRADHSLSAQEDVHLGYATFLPARQRSRVALEVRHTFAWPEENDPRMQEKLKEFVNQRLADTEEFVLFDQADHFQIEFPRGWQEFKLSSADEN